MKLAYILLTATLVLSGCANNSAQKTKEQASVSEGRDLGTTESVAPAQAKASGKKSAVEARSNAMGEAIVAPLNDLNIVRVDIPPVLIEVQKDPYLVPLNLTCEGLAVAVQALDNVLEADLDTPPSATKPNVMDRAGEAAGDALVRSVRNTTEGIIPFRGWVRKLTGAERHSRRVVAAIAAGTVRRAYLKGLGQSLQCSPPAAPIPKVENQEILYESKPGEVKVSPVQ